MDRRGQTWKDAPGWKGELELPDNREAQTLDELHTKIHTMRTVLLDKKALLEQEETAGRNIRREDMVSDGTNSESPDKNDVQKKRGRRKQEGSVDEQTWFGACAEALKICKAIASILGR